MSDASNAQLGRAYYKAVDTDGLDAAPAYVAADYVCHAANHTGAPANDGPHGVLAAYRLAFPDFAHVVIDQVSEDDVVVQRMRCFGTHLGTFMGVSATGRSVTFTAMDWARYIDGKVVERWVTADEAGLRRQLLGEADPKQTDINKALAREYYEANDRYGISTGTAFGGKKSVYHGANHTGFHDDIPPSRGEKYYRAFPDFFHVIYDQIAEGDYVIERIRYYATHRDTFMGIAATNKRITYTGMDWVRFVDGIAVERWGVADSVSIRRQLLGQPDPTPGHTWYGDFPREPTVPTDVETLPRTLAASKTDPAYFDNPVIDRLLTICLELGAAMWVTRDRLEVLEALLAERGVVTPDMIEAYPPPADDPDRRAARDKFIGEIFAALKTL